jgi:hypothetical protein
MPVTVITHYTVHILYRWVCIQVRTIAQHVTYYTTARTLTFDMQWKQLRQVRLLVSTGKLVQQINLKVSACVCMQTVFVTWCSANIAHTVHRWRFEILLLCFMWRVVPSHDLSRCFHFSRGAELKNEQVNLE